MTKKPRLNARMIIDSALVVVVIVFGIRLFAANAQRERPITDKQLIPLHELIQPMQSDLNISRNLVLLMYASVSCPSCQADAQALASMPDSVFSNTSVFIVTRSGDGRAMAEFSRIYANSLPVAEVLEAFSQFFTFDRVPRYFLLDYRSNKVLTTNLSIVSLTKTIEIIQGWIPL